MLRELRQAVRSLAADRGLTTVVLVTLALGIGATTAIFSVVHHVLLRPLPYPEPERLVRIWTHHLQARSDSFPAGHAEYFDYRAESALYDEVGAYTYRPMVLTGAGEPHLLTASPTTSSLWPVLGVEPLLGRTYGESEDKAGGELLVVLSYGLWQRRFGGDPAIAGRTIVLDGVGRTVIGVMPESFRFPGPEVEVWVPFPLDETRRDNHHLWVLGRLRDGATLSQVQPEMDLIVERWEKLYEHAHPFRAASYREEVLGDVRGPLRLLLTAVGFVLGIACVNVAGLLLARGEGRRQEMAVRAALGAGRGRLLGQMLAESSLFGVAGGALGLAVAALGLPALLALEPGRMPRREEIAIDPTVLGFCLGVSLLAGILFGLVPAWRASRPRLVAALNAGGRGATPARQVLRGALVVAEIATAVVVVAIACLLLRSFFELRHADPGFEPERVLTAQISLPASDYPEAHDVEAFYGEAIDGLAALPGVRSVAAVNALYDSIRMVLVRGTWQPSDADPIGADVIMASPGYFQTLGVPLLSGRGFTAADRAGAARVAAVNQALAALLLTGGEPLGKHLTILQSVPQEPTFEVVGVVPDTRTFGLGNEVRPQIFLPLAQGVTQIRGVTRRVTLAVKTEGEATAVAGPLRSALWDLDGRLAVANLQTLSSALAESLARERFLAALLAIFALLALVLAAVGTYGLLAHVVGLRRRELGIRLALGALPRQLRRQVLGRGLALAAAGALLGLGGTLAAGRLLRGFLTEEVATSDLATLLLVPLLLLATAALASLLPARRAAAVDPATSLRLE